jgi:hypothetical protein
MGENQGEENIPSRSQQGWHRAGRQVRQVRNDALEHELDAALSKYAEVEPRPGFEQRLLANLRTERERSPLPVGWRWPASCATTGAVLILALFLSWRTRDVQVGKTVGHNATEASREVPKDRVADTHLPSQPAASVGTAVTKRPRRSTAVVTTAPRLEQFPSPRPLSEQEEILARYVATYPEHATLVARARAEALRRDAVEERRDPAGEGNAQP